MIYFKSCQRCGGDMHPSGDYYGDYRQCLQCGHIVDEENVNLVPKDAREHMKKADSQAA